jgi:pimeloyl-ACP methyl ester carboxylesterase
MASMTFLLVHGGWHGGWCWKTVAGLLRAAGHEVYAPSLTGMGDRAHLLTRDIDLDTHVQDIVGLLQMEDLRDVVLVGHSYGGMVVTGASGKAPDRIRRVVYLDAFVAEDGKCALDYVVAERAARMREEGGRTGFVSPPPVSLWGLTDPRHVDFVRPRETRQPYKTFTQPVRIADPTAYAKLPKTFIYCSSPATGTFDRFADKYRNDKAWRFHELKCGHDAMILMPHAVVEVLVQT